MHWAEWQTGILEVRCEHVHTRADWQEGDSWWVPFYHGEISTKDRHEGALRFRVFFRCVCEGKQEKTVCTLTETSKRLLRSRSWDWSSDGNIMNFFATFSFSFLHPVFRTKSILASSLKVWLKPFRAIWPQKYPSITFDPVIPDEI